MGYVSTKAILGQLVFTEWLFRTGRWGWNRRIRNAKGNTRTLENEGCGTRLSRPLTLCALTVVVCSARWACRMQDGGRKF